MKKIAFGITFTSLLLILSEAGAAQQDFTNVDSLITAAIADSVFPGAVLMIAEPDHFIYYKAYGAHDYAPEAVVTRKDDIFDLASLTKVMATTLSIMRLYEEDKIALSDPVTKYIPEFGQNGKADITIRHLLLHTAGFPPGKPFYRWCHTKAEVLDSLCAMPLRYPTGTQTVYSDIGFITLGRIVELVSDRSLDVFVRQQFYEPLGLAVTGYNPVLELWQRIAPAEPEFNYRLRGARGSPKNKITRAMGGVAGHAGLFSNAEDLAVIARMLLNGGEYRGKSYFQEATIRLFTTAPDAKSSRGLGWDTGGGSGKGYLGDLFSKRSFGHTGFTGTSVWIDPELDLFIIFLSNRSYQMKDRQRMYDFRPVLHETILGSIGGADSQKEAGTTHYDK